MPATSAFVVMPEMLPNLPFELERDFVRIGFIGEQPMVFAVAPALGINSLPELIARAKAKPGEILYAANLRGSLPHLSVELLRRRTGIDLTFVPYPGAAGGLQDIMGGRISMIAESLPPLAGAIQSGVIKPLAIASEKRLPNFPDLPTVAETSSGSRRHGLVRAAGTGRNAGRDRPQGEPGSGEGSRSTGFPETLPGPRHVRAPVVAHGNDRVHPQRAATVAPAGAPARHLDSRDRARAPIPRRSSSGSSRRRPRNWRR